MRLLLILLALSVAVVTEAAPVKEPIAGYRCGTPELLPMLRSRPKPSFIPAPAVADKLVRDGFGGGFQQHLTANFVVKWKDPTIGMSDAKKVGDALELAWSKYIDQLGHRVPTGCATYRLNAYISRDTDNPSIDYAGGYANIDNDGYPYFVISREIFGQAGADGRIRAVAVHEFYHDVQFGIGAYDWANLDSQWYWETTAEWASQETLPDVDDPYVFTGAMLYRSELPLYHYGDPFGSNPVVGVHQYGASLFFRYLTEKLQHPDIVVKSWELAQPNSEPISQVIANLPQGADLPTIYAEYAAKAAFLDFRMKPYVQASLDLYGAAYPSETRIMATVPAAGTTGPMPLTRAPYGYGFSTIEITRPSTGRFEVTVAMSSTQANTKLHGTVVYATANEQLVYTALTVNDTVGTADVTLPVDAQAVYLVVGAFTDERITGAAVSMSLTVSPKEPEPASPDAGPNGGGDGGGGCCGTTSRPMNALVPLAFVVAVLLSRSRPRRGR